MSEISNQLKKVKQSLPENCTLIAVSKTKPSSDIMTAFNAGQIDFGENKVQELVQKSEELPKTIQWHMIGHLQRNKVKYIAPFIYLIHGVDSLRLLKEINKQAEKAGRIIQCLLQVHIGEEDTKFGFDKTELLDALESEDLKEMKHIRISGLMGMATNTSNIEQVRREFNGLNTLFEELKDSNHMNVSMSILSMGMSGDYQIAIEEGSNMVRIGSAIFGSRNYSF